MDKNGTGGLLGIGRRRKFIRQLCNDVRKERKRFFELAMAPDNRVTIERLFVRHIIERKATDLRLIGNHNAVMAIIYWLFVLLVLSSVPLSIRIFGIPTGMHFAYLKLITTGLIGDAILLSVFLL